MAAKSCELRRAMRLAGIARHAARALRSTNDTNRRVCDREQALFRGGLVRGAAPRRIPARRRSAAGVDDNEDLEIRGALTRVHMEKFDVKTSLKALCDVPKWRCASSKRDPGKDD
jgi:hypothetical protein